MKSIQEILTFGMHNNVFASLVEHAITFCEFRSIDWIQTADECDASLIGSMVEKMPEDGANPIRPRTNLKNLSHVPPVRIIEEPSHKLV